MKVRFETRCAYCRRQMNVGTYAIRAHKGLWHQECYLGWRRYREAKKSDGRRD